MERVGSTQTRKGVDVSSLYELLGMEIESKDKDDKPVMVSPAFIVKIQAKTSNGIHVIIHADGHSSDTVSLVIREHEVIEPHRNPKVHHADKHKETRWLIYSKVGNVFFTSTILEMAENPWYAISFNKESEAIKHLGMCGRDRYQHTKLRDWVVQSHLFIYT